MGLRATVVVCVTSFLLGCLFVHWIADSLTLWKSGSGNLTEENLWAAAMYYSVLTRGTPIIFYFLAAVVALGAITILWSLGDGAAGNLMFDGGSIFLFGTTVVLYLYSVVPIILSKFTTLPSHQLKDPLPGSLRSATLGLASNHLMCSVALTGVLVLQAGRFWAERSDDAEVAELRREAALLKGRQSRAKTPDVKA
ncbi:Shr3 amino acid permease chaperone [Mycena galericulata]|nr:Shr3 amino acid permease chaperone [Mycena galericulata]